MKHRPSPPMKKGEGCEIEARALSYTIQTPTRNSNPFFFNPWRSVGGSQAAAGRHVLKGVTLHARPWELLAVVGPSGAGKSTLLEILAGRLPPTSASSLLVDGAPAAADLPRHQRITAYVTQQDTLFPLLTVRETLLFTARLRLSLPSPALAARVDALIAELGLSHVSSARVGNGTKIRGISGGERRRVSIGVTVVHDPSVLILDEPTSGLDSSSALQVVDMLKTMAETRGRTVILSIHQPGFRILKLFSSLLLLADGSVLHHGTVDELHLRLLSLGLLPPLHVNVLEFAIDAIETLQQQQQQEDKSPSSSPLSEPLHQLANKERCTLQQLFQLHKVVDEESAAAAAAAATTHLNPEPWICLPTERICNLYSNESGGAAAISQLNPEPWVCLPADCSDGTAAAAIAHLNPKPWGCSDHCAERICSLYSNESGGYANSWLKETEILTHRFLKNVFRTKELFACRTIQMLASGLVLGSIFYDLAADGTGGFERVGLFAFILTFLLSCTTEGLPVFLQEREILMRETSSGSYRVSSYVIANSLVFLPFLLILAVLFSVPVYWLVGLNRSFPAFMYFVLLIWLILYTANSVVVCFSALVPNFIVGNSVISGVMGSFFLFSGYFISREGMPGVWVFMHYLSLFKYPFEGLLVNEFAGGGRRCLEYGLMGVCVMDGEDLLREEGLGRECRWRNVMVMVGFIVVYRLCSYLVLMCRCWCDQKGGLKRGLVTR